MVKLRCQEIGMMRWVLSSSKSLRVNNQWVRNSILHSYPQQSSAIQYNIGHLALIFLHCKWTVNFNKYKLENRKIPICSRIFPHESSCVAAWDRAFTLHDQTSWRVSQKVEQKLAKTPSCWWESWAEVKCAVRRAVSCVRARWWLRRSK